MSDVWESIQPVVLVSDVSVSVHGLQRLRDAGLRLAEIVAGAGSAVLIENYPGYHKGPSVLVLQLDQNGNPVHVVWGLAKGTTSPAVIVAAYRPDPRRWSKGFVVRRKS